MDSLSFSKILIILVIALFVIGPTRLPEYAKKFSDFVRSVKRAADGAKDRLKDEMGPEFDDVDWKQLDPRQYDPRRIIRDALVEDEREARQAERRERLDELAAARRARQGISAEGAVSVRFDDEAT
ncbi:sec-independent protein translocase protein TatB [Mycolicibacterium mucogenicum 261Sha1.1M5]|uniref:Sec-independent protein translocase protein TatB n=1 Tax=Leucobacter aridicollis TaxID=283878 RepID=A0A852REG5_9MICO|nr:twin-arginine translocase TatA/TatE family subunit [Leucobacter aridicollis]MBL3681713.1 translocase [Leucobacter aridicollis]MCS3427926.1 sec-independent protein translocase protein TatB [Leucobacter aridicollis]NYD27250.1 sec-independent protein translocase protein TatB [Leucobacter aridicollis]RKQ94810.1 sec-independent protein translocase protein TatB [Mycolicibacterium mucogenicum 261Sha1.1M5]